MAGCKEQNPVQGEARKDTPCAGIKQLDAHKGAGRKASHSLSGSALPAPAAEGTLPAKPTPDKRQEHTAMGKGFSPGPDVVTGPGEAV